MNDINNDNASRTYTKEEVLELFRRFRNEEKLIINKNKEEYALPMDIVSTLEDNSKLQLQESFKRYRKDLTKYTHDDWTVAEEINKSLVPKLKQHTVETNQLVSSIYKETDIRTLGRGATKIFEQLQTIKEGEISGEEANTILEEAFESAKRLSIFAWAQGKPQDNEAREFALKALRLPTSLKHLETKETGKKEAFSSEFIEQYNEARFQQSILRSATTTNAYGNGRGGYNNNHQQHSRGGKGFYRGGKNYFGGRGRGNPTYQQGQHSHSHQQSQQLYQPRGETDKSQ